MFQMEKNSNWSGWWDEKIPGTEKRLVFMGTAALSTFIAQKTGTPQTLTVSDR